jgi:hypothetical protein
MFYLLFAGCHHAECYYAVCRGAKSFSFDLRGAAKLTPMTLTLMTITIMSQLVEISPPDFATEWQHVPRLYFSTFI